MTHLHMATEVAVIRLYDAPGGYEARRPYRAILRVTFLSDKVAHLHCAVGQIDRAAHAAAMAMLRERGVTTVQYERRGQMKTIELAKLLGNE